MIVLANRLSRIIELVIKLKLDNRIHCACQVTSHSVRGNIQRLMPIYPQTGRGAVLYDDALLLEPLAKLATAIRLAAKQEKNRSGAAVSIR